jgi:2-C-methyl-D-erythritol 4-phosphate cytidylyltransferase
LDDHQEIIRTNGSTVAANTTHKLIKRVCVFRHHEAVESFASKINKKDKKSNQTIIVHSGRTHRTNNVSAFDEVSWYACIMTHNAS